MKKLLYKNTALLMRPHAHGFHHKDLIVLHETISSDVPGWNDITAVESFLAAKDYGIHGLTDAEGHIAWALGLGAAIFWQAGGVNERSIGIEQVSRVPLQAPSNALRRSLWASRSIQLRSTAKLIAAVSRAQGIPLVYSNGLHPGVTSHWDVSQHFSASEGHTDCFPYHKGGYYPILQVIRLAKLYYRLGYTL